MNGGMGPVEFLRDCMSRKMKPSQSFFLPTSSASEEKIKKSYSQKTLQKAVHLVQLVNLDGL